MSRLSQEAINTAMQSPTHLKRWLEETGRRWLTFDGLALVDALPWPAGIEALVQIVGAYRDHRAVQPAGRTEEVETDFGDVVEIPVYKGEHLEVEELDRAIRYLVSEMLQHDPEWKLENAPL